MAQTPYVGPKPEGLELDTITAARLIEAGQKESVRKTAKEAASSVDAMLESLGEAQGFIHITFTEQGTVDVAWSSAVPAMNLFHFLAVMEKERLSRSKTGDDSSSS